MPRQETLNEFLQRHQQSGKPIKIPEEAEYKLTTAEKDKLAREYVKHLEAKQKYIFKKVKNR